MKNTWCRVCEETGPVVTYYSDPFICDINIKNIQIQEKVLDKIMVLLKQV